MPSILFAILTGSNTSSSVDFSPIPMNLIGFSVIALIDKAAPPLLSPSNLVIIIPFSSHNSLNFFATFTASCPVSPSTTRSVSLGLILDLI